MTIPATCIRGGTSKGYRSSAGVDIAAERIDLLARIMSMGKLHALSRRGARCSRD